MPKARRRRASGRRRTSTPYRRYRSRVRRTGSTPYDIGVMEDVRVQWNNYRRRYGRKHIFERGEMQYATCDVNVSIYKEILGALPATITLVTDRHDHMQEVKSVYVAPPWNLA